MTQPETITTTDPVEAEATGKPITLEWKGLSFTLPPSIEDCDVEVLEALEEGKATGIIRGLIGDREWKRLKAKAKPKIRDIEEFSEMIAQALGFDSAGE